MRVQNQGLYDPSYEHDACGVGFVARVDGEGTRAIVEQGLEILRNMAHRGAAGSDPETGDGAGIMLQVPDAFYRRVCDFELPAPGDYAVGTLFVSDGSPEEWESELKRIVTEEGQEVVGFREVPVEPGSIGRLARQVMPGMRQVFIERKAAEDRAAFERKLYVIRRRLHSETGGGCYVVSLSASTIVYKGLIKGEQLLGFYRDLQEPDVVSALALVHERFSTNTLGAWDLAHPYRYVAHNGEINTLRGNVNWMRSRESQLESPLFGDDLQKIFPIVKPGGSDSAAFDNALELLTLAGRSLPHAVMMMMPEAWENDELMDPDRRAFYSYHSALTEPWDGPAAVAFTDGRLIGAALDRNGLRPARYSITRDGRVVMASEEGVLPLDPAEVIKRGRLKPGKMLVVDLEGHRVMEDDEVKDEIISRQPYAEWLARGEVHFEDLPDSPERQDREPAELLERQRTFGYTLEDLGVILGPMAEGGKEPDGSMGTDTPLAILSERPQLLFNYFKQLFAQVTNPPIDPLREELVMSLKMSLGPEDNFFDETPEHCERILLDHPILTGRDLRKLRELDREPFKSDTLKMLFRAEEGEAGLARDLAHLCEEAERSVQAGSTVLILSDREVDAERAPIPSLLATSAVHQHLVRSGVRTKTTLVVETAEAREVHHFALLVGFGATAINPYLAFETINSLVDEGVVSGSRQQARENYIKGLQKGLLKIISKMGISTLLSYCGAQIFEAVGLDQEMVEKHFTGTASRIGGIGLEGIAREALERHGRAFAGMEVGPPELDIGGEYHLRMQGEYHQWNSESVVALQRAVRTKSYETFKQYTAHFDAISAKRSTLRGMVDFERDPIPVDEVESAREIVKRFSTGAISMGSISKESHEGLALAMNQIGGRSNTGEGGEDSARFDDDRRSAIKQVASGRFGVTAHYLVNSDSIQIKMAQGSKPGEGGQLPGHKVSEEIASLRYSTPGVSLISPPPHHDIYSIEDLAQLIHDLKNSNPRARISVKLVSAVGVGTIAAGVAKAKADHITISGHDGGTGSSPLSSIKHAGLPWELGVAETQQVLVENDLRGRVILQTDGQLKTGRDVVVAGLLGAEDFGFSTAPLVAQGCIMMRVCHLNTCPVGIATQDPELRKKFAGTPEHVINYFFFLAEEVRELMAELGFRTFEEMIGRSDRMKMKSAAESHWKTAGVDLRAMLHRPEVSEEVSLHNSEEQYHNLDQALDNELIRRSDAALERREPVRFESPIRNINRTVGGMLSGEIARRHGLEGLEDGTLRIDFTGTAGQSFGAWAASGLTMKLTGETNDYVGKGLSGGRIVVTPSERAAYEVGESVVIGNVALYGATSGEAYFRGVAGERFAVRNSGARTVVEGVGEHGCEYMTGGVVVILGSTGRNFAAGMSGGLAFVLDEAGDFEQRCNLELVGLESAESDEDAEILRSLIERHLEWTGSEKARRILENLQEYLPKFVKVMPHELRRVLDERELAEAEAV